MAFPAVIWHLRALISMEIGLQKKITVTGIFAEQQAVAYSTIFELEKCVMFWSYLAVVPES